MISDFATLFCYSFFTRVVRAEGVVMYFEVSNGHFNLTFFMMLFMVLTPSGDLLN